MAGDANDPRVYLAAERTLLAWVRTGLTVMALGFAVVRQDLGEMGATLSGVTIVLLGASALVAATYQYSRFFRNLDPAELPRPNLAAWSVGFAGVLSVVGVVLAGYLVVSSLRHADDEPTPPAAQTPGRRG